MFGYQILGFGGYNRPAGGGGIDGLPEYSLSFVRASSQAITQTSANANGYNKDKFAISLWLKRSSTGTTQGLLNHYTGGSDAFFLIINGSNKLVFATYADGVNIDGRLITTAAYTSTSSWYHIMVHYDGQNATAGDRMRMWVNGSEVTAFSTDSHPSQTGVYSSSFADVEIGVRGGSYCDGLMYQPALFSNYLPSIGEVYNAGSPVDIGGITGLYLLADGAGADPTHDAVLTTAWTNVGSATTSTTIPT